MEENWKPCPGAEGSHMVSSKGRIKLTSFNEIVLINGHSDAYGYTIVTINNKPCKVHRLVALAFIPNPNNKPQINHIDGQKGNNNIENLEWVTASENLKHSYDFLSRKVNTPKGEDCNFSKLTEQQALEIINSNAPAIELADKYGITWSHVYGIKSGKAWGHLQKNLTHSDGRAKLTDAQVIEIFNSKERVVDIVKKYGIKKSIVYLIKAGLTRKHLHKKE